MSDMNNDIDRSIAALQAVDLIRSCYGAGEEGCRRVEDVVKQLAMNDNGMGQFGGLRKNIADAISKAYLNQPLKP